MDKDFLSLGGKLERWLLRLVVLAAVLLVSMRWFAYDPVLQVMYNGLLRVPLLQ